MINMVYIGCDHAGFELKNKIIKQFNNNIIDYIDLTKKVDIYDDYNDVAKALCNSLKNNDFGILICGTGIGMSIAANRFNNIRAALCFNKEMAHLAREHNNSNVLCLGKIIEDEKNKNEIFNIINVFLETKFSSEERHIRRVKKLGEGV